MKPEIYDIALIQEPYIDHLGRSRANQHWIVVYPPPHNEEPSRTRSIILVNRRIATNSWTQIEVDSFDITGIQLHGEFGTLRIYNVYNDCKHNDSLTVLTNRL
ncbi:hypothetical protein GALMADRAFT_81370, partial [Galerina marginata CBS 339.88]